MSAGKLPEGWEQIEIGDIADVISGGTPKSGVAENFAPSGEGVAWLTPADLSGYKEKYISHGARDLTTLGYSSCSAKLMPKGTILFSSRAPIGYVAIAANEIATNQGFKSFAFPSDIFPDYAYYFLRNIRHIAEEMGTGTTFKEISGSSAKTLPFVLVPFAEQKIIAEKLDTLLAQVESTKARLEQIPQILKRFRQAVLHVAVSGKLTEKWRLENATLENSYEWKIQSLSDLGVLARGKSKHRPRNDPRLFGDKYPFIQTGEVANSSGRIKGANKFYSEFGLSQSKLFPKDTLCITIAANIADTAILEIEACFPDSVVGFISDRNKSHVSFVKYLIDVNKDNLEAFAPATAQKNINLKVLNELKLPIPDIKEQHEIVRRVEQLFAYADTIEKQVNNALARVNNLTQSILAKAFRGELTVQWRAENPDLISGENSAAALLEKIKAERAASGGKKASRKKS